MERWVGWCMVIGPLVLWLWMPITIWIDRKEERRVRHNATLALR